MLLSAPVFFEFYIRNILITSHLSIYLSMCGGIYHPPGGAGLNTESIVVWNSKGLYSWFSSPYTNFHSKNKETVCPTICL